MILSIDPGLSPGYVLLDRRVLVPRRFYRPAPLVVGAWSALPEALHAEVTDVIVEGQWLYGAQKRDAILTLGIEAGWQLRRACERFGGRPHVIKPQAWREALGLGRATKKVAQSRCTGSLLPVELDQIACRSAKARGDRIDAVLVGWGWAASPTTPWKEPP